MSATINPEIRDLQQKVEEMRINLARTQGEIEIIKHNSERNDRQTIKQFVIFTITMLIAVVTCLVGTSVFQTDALRREISARFEAVNQRFDSIDKRMEKLEKSIDELKQDLRSRR
jgi:chromosome segregation ATPase